MSSLLTGSVTNLLVYFRVVLKTLSAAFMISNYPTVKHQILKEILQFWDD